VITINISTTIYNVISTNQSNDRLKNLLSHKPITIYNRNTVVKTWADRRLAWSQVSTRYAGQLEMNDYSVEEIVNPWFSPNMQTFSVVAVCRYHKRTSGKNRGQGLTKEFRSNLIYVIKINMQKTFDQNWSILPSKVQMKISPMTHGLACSSLDKLRMLLTLRKHYERHACGG
jgi:hypothetical protein